MIVKSAQYIANGSIFTLQLRGGLYSWIILILVPFYSNSYSLETLFMTALEYTRYGCIPEMLAFLIVELYVDILCNVCSGNTLKPEQNGWHFADDILDTFPWIKMYGRWLNFRRNLCQRVHLMINNYPNQWWPSLMMPYDATRPQWVNMLVVICGRYQCCWL